MNNSLLFYLSAAVGAAAVCYWQVAILGVVAFFIYRQVRSVPSRRRVALSRR